MEMNLQIIETPKGEVKTNLAELRTFVAEKLTEYDPEKYTGDVASAKKARAELNKSAGYVKDGRKQLEDYMRDPFSLTLDGLKEIEQDIKSVSANIDLIVKTKEQEEKDEKKSLIEAYWASTQFDLFSLDKVFDQKWLNKGTSIKAIKEEMTATQEKALSELQIIERLPEDVDTLKALYLQNLNISDTLAQADTLKKNRELANKEKAERAERALRAQQNELGHEELKAQESQPTANLASLAMEEEPDDDPELTFTLEFTGKQSELFAMRQFMTDHGITYKKL